MAKWIFLPSVMILFVFINLSYADTTIQWNEAHNYYGQNVEVTGKIVSTYNSGEVCYLNFHSGYEKYLRAVIFKSVFQRFTSNPEIFYRGKQVRISGKITEYQDRPQIILYNPSQIRVIETVNQPKIVTPPLKTEQSKNIPVGLIIIIIIIGAIVIGVTVANVLKNTLRKTVKDEINRQFSRQFSKLANNALSPEEIEKLKNSIKGETLYNEAIRSKLEEAFSKANKEVDIISPWLSFYAIDNKLLQLMENAFKRGVVIKLVYGYEGGNSEKQSHEVAEKLKTKFKNYEKLFQIKQVNTHEKLLLCDDIFFLIGSFNLLSFDGKYNEQTRKEMMLCSNESKILRDLRWTHFNF